MVQYGIMGKTARTLDEVDGECPLQEGIMSRSGCSQIDDSHSLVLDETAGLRFVQEMG